MTKRVLAFLLAMLPALSVHPQSALKGGLTSRTVSLLVRDSSSTTGAGLSGLAYNAAGLTCYYTRERAAPVQITLATQTPTGAWSSGGWVQYDATTAKGQYRLDVPDAAVAAGVPSVVINCYGATNMSQVFREIQIQSFDVEDGVRGGFTAMPNAAAEAAGGLFTRGSGAGQIAQDANGQINVNVEFVNDDAASASGTVTFPNATLASTGNITGGTITTCSALTTNNDKTGYALSAAGVTAVRAYLSGTADSGSTTTLVDDALTQADADWWRGATLLMTSGTLAGQHRIITAFDAGTDTVTLESAFTAAVASQTYEILASGRALLAATTHTGATVPTVTTATTATNLTNLPTMPTGWVTADGIAADAVGSSELAATARQEITAYVADTADSGTTTTLVDAARTEADADYWAGAWLLITSGSTAGQVRRISAFTPASDTITVASAFTQAIGTNTYEILRTSGTEAPGAGATDWSAGEKSEIRYRLSMSGSQTDPATTTGGVEVAAGAITSTEAPNLDAATSSRMATYTQPTGFLAASFPSAVSSLTQTQVTGGAYSLGSASAVLGDARIANLDAAVSSRGTSTLTQTQVTGGAYSLASSSLVLGDTRIAYLDAAVSSRSTLGGTAQTGDSYALVNSGVFGLSVLETLVDDLESRLSAARAGYLDNLSGGAVFLAASAPTNFSLLGINGSGHLSRVTLTDTATTLTGHTAQTGDSFARIGATGSGLTSLAPSATALSTAVWTPTKAGYIDAAISSVGGGAAPTVAQIWAYDVSGGSGTEARYVLSNAGAAGDPNTSSCAAYGTPGSIGYNICLIGGGGVIRVTPQPITTGQKVEIIRGDDYVTGGQGAIPIEGLAGLSASDTIRFEVLTGNTRVASFPVTYVSASTAELPLDAALSWALTKASYRYNLVKTTTGSLRVTPLRDGEFVVKSTPCFAAGVACPHAAACCSGVCTAGVCVGP